MIAMCAALGQMWHLPRPFQGFDFLQTGDVVEIRLESRGCFHHSIHWLRFEQGKDLRVRAVEESDPSTHPQARRVPWPKGDRLVDKSHVPGLNQYVTFLRENKSDGCTTVDTIGLIHLRGKSIMASERLKDASCASSFVFSDEKEVRDLYNRPDLRTMITFSKYIGHDW